MSNIAYYRPTLYANYPIFGAFGAETPASGTVKQGADPQQIANIVSAVATTVDAIRDPIQRAAVIRARIENYRKMRASIPGMAWWYDNQINILSAKLQAAEYEARLQRQADTATGTWRSLGQSSVIVGIALGVVLTAAILKKVAK